MHLAKKELFLCIFMIKFEVVLRMRILWLRQVGKPSLNTKRLFDIGSNTFKNLIRNFPELTLVKGFPTTPMLYLTDAYEFSSLHLKFFVRGLFIVVKIV